MSLGERLIITNIETLLKFGATFFFQSRIPYYAYGSGYSLQSMSAIC